MGGRCPRSPECCPRWIGITVRNQSESLSAIAGIRRQSSDEDALPIDTPVDNDFLNHLSDGQRFLCVPKTSSALNW